LNIEYELLLKGRFYRGKSGVENYKKAVEYFHQAIAIDPHYALAHAELSDSYRLLTGVGGFDPKELTPKAEAATRKALELDENLAEAHLALAGIKRDAWDWAAAEREYERTIELNLNLDRAHHSYALYLSLMGRHEQAITEAKRSRELDPLSLPINVRVGHILYFARRYDEAIAESRKALELDRNFPYAHGLLGQVYTAKGVSAEAIAEYQEAIKLGGSPGIYLGAAYAQAGEREQAQAILKRLQTTGGYVSPGELAILYAALGEREQAFASLEQAYAARDPQLQFLGVDPAYDSLRSDPRFQDLLRRVGLAP
jgi:tetratricopeptide (TPR) repeat protein